MTEPPVTDPSPDCGYTAPIPGPDPGACPDCGSWRKAGMIHECDTGAEQAQVWQEILRLREFGEHYSGAAQDAWDRIAVLEATLEAAERERDEAQALLGVARNQRDAWKQTVVARTKDAAAAERRADEVEKALARVTSYRKHDPAAASPERIRSFDSDHDDAEALLATAVVSADSLAAVPIYGGSTDDGHTFDLASPESAEARVAVLEAALREILNELGVPGDGYPAPVANAVHIARDALTAYGQAAAAPQTADGAGAATDRNEAEPVDLSSEVCGDRAESQFGGGRRCCHLRAGHDGPHRDRHLRWSDAEMWSDPEKGRP